MQIVSLTGVPSPTEKVPDSELVDNLKNSDLKGNNRQNLPHHVFYVMHCLSKKKHKNV